MTYRIFAKKITNEIILQEEDQYTMVDIKVLMNCINTFPQEDRVTGIHLNGFIARNPVFLSADNVGDKMLFQQHVQVFHFDWALVFQDQVAIPHQFSNGWVCSEFVVSVKKHGATFLNF